MRIRLIAPAGKKYYHARTERYHSEVICDERKRGQYVLTDAPDDPLEITADDQGGTDRTVEEART